jgi:thioredoxin reductase (NADPH)
MRGAGTFDCLIIGGGPAGLAAALYLARFRRRLLLIDSGAARAASIPRSHNIPFFTSGIGGPELLARERENALRYDAEIVSGTVTGLRKLREGFLADTMSESGKSGAVRAACVLLATGASDIEPKLPNLPHAVQRGLVRYCPICDGYEVMNKSVAVIGYGERGLGEAVFIARTYTPNVTLLTLGEPMELDSKEKTKVEEHNIKVVGEPIVALDCPDKVNLRAQNGEEHRFDVLYSALGMRVRSELATSLGAAHDEEGGIIVDEHSQTNVDGLYAAGDVTVGLRQIVVGLGQAARAAVHIHNRLGKCEAVSDT